MFRRKLNETDLRRMRIPERHWQATLSKIQAGGKGQPQKMIKRYFNKLKTVTAKGVGLLLWGPNGSGKTAAAVVIAKEMRRHGLSVLFLEAASLSRVIIDREQFDAESSLWERATTADVLVLDDLGKGSQDSTGFGLRKLDELLRQRTSRLKVTIVTTNMNLKQLASSVKPSTMHILKEALFPILVDGVDHREEIKRSIAQQLMED